MLRSPRTGTWCANWLLTACQVLNYCLQFCAWYEEMVQLRRRRFRFPRGTGACVAFPRAAGIQKVLFGNSHFDYFEPVLTHNGRRNSFHLRGEGLLKLTERSARF